MEIIRGTTPSIIISLEDGVTFSDIGNAILRIKQNNIIVDKEPFVVSGNEATFIYSQDETLKFYEGTASIQLIGVKGTNNEIVNKTETYTINILKSLWNEAVHNE